MMFLVVKASEKTGVVNAKVGQIKRCYLLVESKSMKLIIFWCNNTLLQQCRVMFLQQGGEIGSIPIQM